MFRAGVLLLLVAAAAASIHPTTETVYRQGKEYIYKYESQVLTGVPNVANVASGIKMRCDVRLQVANYNKMVMKLESVKLYKVQEDLEEVSIDEPVPERYLTELVESEVETLLEYLYKPVEFRYELGEISKLVISKEEPYFTVNIKKGILNLLNIDLIERKPVEEVSYKKDFRNIVLVKTPYEETQVLKVWEESTIGECETLYSVHNVPTESVPELYVSKVVDINKCKTAPLLNGGILSSLTFRQENIEKKNELLKGISNVEYKLNGDRRNFLVKEAELKTAYSLTPLAAEKSGDVVSYIRQKLVLEDIVSVQDRIEVVYQEMTVKVQPLMMELPLHLSKESHSDYSSKEPREIEVLEQKVKEILNTIVTVRSSRVEETPELIEDLVMVLRHLPSRDIVRIVKELYSERKFVQKEVLLDVLPTLSTPNVVPVVIEIIKEKLVSSQRAQLILNMVAVTVTPVPEVVKMLLPTTTLYREEIVREDSMLRHTMYLTLGSLVHRMREVAHLTSMVESPVYTELINLIVSEIKQTYYSSEYEDKIVILKAVANTGLPEFIPLVVELVNTEQLPTELRILSIFAMRRMPERVYREVQKVLIPVFLKETFPSDVRISAYLAIMHTEPSVDVLRMIVHIINKDLSVNREVLSYVYRHMTAISRSEIPARLPLKFRVLRVIKFVRPIIPSLVHNTVYSVEGLLKSLGVGVVGDIHLLQGQSAVIPENIISKISAHLFGMDFSVIENGWTVKGMREVLSKLVGPDSVLERYPEYAPLKELIRKILVSEEREMVHNKVSSVVFSEDHEEYRTIDRESPVSFLSSYLTVFGNELRTFGIDEKYILDVISGRTEPRIADIEMITEFLKEVRRGYTVDTVKSVYLPLTTVSVPTPIGLPLNLNLTSVVVMNLRGTVKVDNIPTTVSELMSYTLPEEITASVDVVPEVAMHVHGVMGIDASFLKTGAMLKVKSVVSKIPVNVKAVVDTRDYSIRTEVVVPQEKIDLLSVSVVPSVFTTRVKRLETVNVPSMKNLIVKPIVNLRTVKPVTVKVPVPVEILGIEVRTEVSFPAPVASYTPVFLLNGETVVKVVYEPTSKVARSVESKVKYVYTESSDYERQYRTGRQSTYKVQERIEEELSVFEEVVPESIINSPIRREVYAEVKVRGPEEVSVRGLTTLFYSPDYLVYQVNTQWVAPYVERVEVVVNSVVDIGLLTVPTVDISEPKVLLKSSVRLYETVVRTEIVTSPREVIMEKADVPYWVYTLKNFIPNVEVNQVPSVHHNQQHEKSYLSFWPFASEKVVKENRYSDESSVHENVVLPVEVTSSDRYYVAKVEYESITPTLYKNLMALDWLAVVPVVLPYTSVFQTDRPVEEGKIVMKTWISPVLSRVAVIVEPPVPMDFLVEFPLPSTVEPSYMLVKPAEEYLSPTLWLSKPKSIKTSPFRGECRVKVEESHNKIEGVLKTFDKKEYRVPYVPSGCDVVLATDCTNRNLFSVLLKKTPRNVIAKIVTGNDVLEIIPQIERDWIVVRKNGKEHTIPEDKPLMLKNNKGKEEYELRIVDGKVSVHHVILSVTLVTDFDSYSVQVSPFYKGQMCGLCGDYDSKTDSFRTKHGKSYPWYLDQRIAPIPFLVPMDESCDVERLRVENEEMIRRLDDPKVERKCVKEERTYYTEMEIGNKKKMCFSIKPVHQCVSRECEPVRPIRQKVQLHCIDKDLQRTKDLVREVDIDGRVLRELKYNPVHESIEIEVPEMCVHRGW